MPASRSSRAATAAPAPPELLERQRFLGLTQEDLKLLAGLRKVVAEHATEIVDRFYDHLLRFEPVRHHVADPDTVVRLKQVQHGYLLSLTDGRVDAAYMENRLRIGRVHERIGLQPQWYLGAYGVFMDALCPLIMERHRRNRARGVQACLALEKLMNLDAQIVLDAYFQTRQQRAVERSEQLAAVGELAASIAHEVRNPLAGMKGALEMLGRHLSADPSRAEVVDEIMAQIVRLEHLVRDLLTYARPRPLSRQPVELHHLLDRVLRMVQEEGTGVAIQVDRDYHLDAARLMADPQQLEQVFLNLVQNAIQAMEAGGGLAVTTRREGETVTIAFADTGRGIAPADMRRIFQPFYTTRHRGSGLGLAIVRKILEVHGGSIEMDSEMGRGTTARVILPAGEADE